jgi:hypothetical protein
LVFLSASVNAQTTVMLEHFGAKPNSFENASPAMIRALQYCKGKQNVTLKLPGGRIDLWPEGCAKKELYISNTTENDTFSKVKNIAILLEGFRNFTIDGNQTMVILHGKMVSFALLHCENITIKNLSIDYERPTMSEMTVLSLASDESTTQIHPDTKYAIDNGKIIFYGEGWKSNHFHTIAYNQSDNTMKYSSLQPFLSGKATQIGQNQVKFTGDFSKSKFKIGDVLSIRDPYRDNCGGFITLSKNIKLTNINIHYMHGLGIISQFAENISITKVNVGPQKSSGRIISSFADCFHFSGCKGKIFIDSCTTSGSHDDPINVHGTHLKIEKIAGTKTMTVKFMHHQTYGFEAFFKGDTIVFVNPATLQILGNAVVKSAKLVSRREMHLETVDPIPSFAKAGYCVENITWTPEVTISHCQFEKTNTRGILMTTRRKVIIEHNTFTNVGMHAILIANDGASWYESGPVTDVTIRNNIFDGCGYNSAPDNYVISIAPENHEPVADYFVHKNITIENNIFKALNAPILAAKSVKNLKFVENKIVQSTLTLPISSKSSFQLNGCDQVKISNNSFDVSWKPSIQNINMDKTSISSDLKNE